MPSTPLTAKELDSLRFQEPELVVMDVRLPEEHQRHRIAGSVSNCVHEVAFPTRLPGLLKDKDTPVCVYGESATSHEAAMAEEKLLRAGYRRVYRLNDCLTGWCAEDLPQEGDRKSPEPPPPLNGRLSIDTAESRVEWLGRNLLNKHTGRIPVKAGHLDFKDNAITGGEFTLAMTDITCDDLTGNPYHDVLIAHLRSDDFFDTELHPEARIEITRATPVDNAPSGSQNLHVEAMLTLKGITAPVEFTASVGLTPEGRPAAQAAFSIDRTRWNVLYGSGRFFSRLAGHLVNDLIELQVRIVLQPA